MSQNLSRGRRHACMFEALVIDWLKEASTAAVSRLMGLSWNAIDGIMQRAVKRG
ncbi:transposase family protein, partial [Thiolapillus sp.]|uniref:transposase family protein n=1 Tax=Thiolapillus sp. TaxID=2017437 RepID=UPI003AF63D7A